MAGDLIYAVYRSVSYFSPWFMSSVCFQVAAFPLHTGSSDLIYLFSLITALYVHKIVQFSVHRRHSRSRGCRAPRSLWHFTECIACMGEAYAAAGVSSNF